MLENILNLINAFFFVYMFLYAIAFFCTTFMAALNLDDFFVRKKHMSYAMLANKSNYVPISILVPAYNEEVTVLDTVESLLSLDYPDYEIVVVNDGSKDKTAQKVIDYYGLKQVARPVKRSVPCEELVSIYESDTRVRIVLANKKNGGKADALNMGINISRFPLFVCMDADSMLQKDALQKIVEAFLENDETIAVGGNVKVSNNTVIEKGCVVENRVPKKPLVLFQMVEYLRVFLASRVAFNSLNANLIISGAFGLYVKKAAINVGGYTLGVIGEDMELIVKMHAFYRKNNIPYRISYIPDAVCWTQVPESIKVLKSQRRRWHVGMGESLKHHMFMLFNPKYGTVGMIAFPYFLFFEYITPLLDILGVVSIVASYILGLLNIEFFIIYLLVYMGYSMVVSMVSILLEKYLFSDTMSVAMMFKLFLFAVLESFGFRQLASTFRFGAFFGRSKKQWGNMVRTQVAHREEVIPAKEEGSSVHDE